jgi:glycosyltransferase involved in cell wall biosynthesis
MTRLLIATTIPLTVEAFLLPFAAHFRALGWRVDALTGGALSERARAAFDVVHATRWSRNPVSPRNLWCVPREIRALQESVGYDIVHVHTPVAAFVTRYALRRMRAGGGPRVIYTAHGFHFHSRGGRLSNGAFAALERLGGRWTDHLIVINREDEASANRHRLVPHKRIVRMPGIGVDTKTLSEDRVSDEAVAQVRTELGLASHDRYFLVVAEFTRNKRHEDVVRAFRRASSASRTTPHLVLAGTGPTETSIRSLSQQLGIGDRVHFLGFRSDIPILMRGSSAVVLASAREGLPRSVLEAMALGVPVIVSRTRGSSELVEGGCGHSFEVGDEPGLAEALTRVLNDPDDALARARRALVRVREYDTCEVIRMHEELYHAALAAADRSTHVPQP